MSGLICHFCANKGTDGLPLVWIDWLGRSVLMHGGNCKPYAIASGTNAEDAGECTHKGITCDEYEANTGCPPMAPGHAKCAECYGAVPFDQLLAAERHMEMDAGSERKPLGTSARGRWIRFGPDEFKGWLSVPEGTDGVILEGEAMCRDCADRRWPDDARRRKWRPSVQMPNDERPSGDEALAAKVPTQGAGIAQLTTIWGKSERGVREAVKRMSAAGLLTSTEAPTRVGGAARKTYFATPVETP